MLLNENMKITLEEQDDFFNKIYFSESLTFYIFCFAQRIELANQKN